MVGRVAGGATDAECLDPDDRFSGLNQDWRGRRRDSSREIIPACVERYAWAL